MTGAARALQRRLVALALGPGLAATGCSVETTAQELACYETTQTAEPCLARDKVVDRLPTIGEGVCNRFRAVSVEEGPVERPVEAQRREGQIVRSCCYLATYDLGSNTDICLGGRPLVVSARLRHASLEPGSGRDWV